MALYWIVWYKGAYFLASYIFLYISKILIKRKWKGAMPCFWIFEYPTRCKQEWTTSPRGKVIFWESTWQNTISVCYVWKMVNKTTMVKVYFQMLLQISFVLFGVFLLVVVVVFLCYYQTACVINLIATVRWSYCLGRVLF